MEKAGAFESLSIYSENEITPVKPFWRQKENIKVYIAACILVTTYLTAALTDFAAIFSTIGYAVAIIIGGYTLFITGVQNLSKLIFDMKTLMTIAIIGAAIIGEWSEGAAVVVLFAISEALERFSMDKARHSIASLMDMAPQEALIRIGQIETMVNVRDIQVGNIMIVKPGQKLPMDGVVIKGSSSVNQAAITGESIPVIKTIADEVFAGTLNMEGLLEVKVTKEVQDTTLAKIINLVEKAQEERAPAQAFVDKFAQYYTPAIITFAVLIAILPPLLLSGEWSVWIYQGLATLVVGCPCALVISTPVAIVTAIGNAAKNGVLIKGGVYLETAGTLDVIAFDKTGTLTQGTPVLTDIAAFGTAEDEMLNLAAALENGSQHLLGIAIVKEAYLKNLNFADLLVEDFQAITGKGIKAVINQTVYYLGSPSLFSELGLIPEEAVSVKIAAWQTEGKTVVALGTENKILALFAAIDQIRPYSNTMIQKLHQMGIQKTVMLTGDNWLTAQTIGKEAGVTDIKADLLPEDKLSLIKKLQEQGNRVAMVGDGVNDAPAMAAANMGIAMGGIGTDTALETADITLMSDDLSKLPYTILLGRKTLSIIKQNITFALIVKTIALLLVIPAWLTLWIAVFADMGATLIVTLNSLRLMKVRK